MSTVLWTLTIVASLAAIGVVMSMWRTAVVVRRQSSEFMAHAEEWRAAHQELAGLLKRYLALQEGRSAQEKQRLREDALPRFNLVSSIIANGTCTVTLGNLGPTASRVRMEFRPPLATGATPQFDVCQAGTVQCFAAQFGAGRPGMNDELRVSYTDASGCNASEIYGMARTSEATVDFYLVRRERAMWA